MAEKIKKIADQLSHWTHPEEHKVYAKKMVRDALEGDNHALCEVIRLARKVAMKDCKEAYKMLEEE